MRHWLERPVFLPLRIPLAGIYKLLVSANNFAFDRGLRGINQIDVPVISVGNLSVGGSGKTLVVETLARHIQASGMKPGILSRGYGRSSRGLMIVSDGQRILTTVSGSGDEALLLASLLPDCPVVVSGDRYPGALKLQNDLEVDCILLDDGFQHRKLHRDLDIVLLDASILQKPRMLPWGYLREPLTALQRAHQIIYSKVSREDRLTDKPVLDFEYPGYVIAADGSQISPKDIQGQCGVFAGLGNPDFFFEAVAGEIGAYTTTLTFPDHCPYHEQDLNRIRNTPVDYWITTAKDAVKLSSEFRQKENVYTLPVSVKLPPAVLASVDTLLTSGN